MTCRLTDRIWRWFALCTVAGTAARTCAQQRTAPVQEPRLLTFNLTQTSVGLYSEGQFERASYDDSGVTATHNRIFIGPLLGVNFDGSVFHPNLMTYQVNSEGAFGWARDNLKSSSSLPNGTTTSVIQNETQYLGRFNATANFLASKPYNATLFANYDHTYNDNDFFTRLVVDLWRYGGQVAYQQEAFGVTASFTHRDETVSGYNGVSNSSDNTANLLARNDRGSGGSQLSYIYNNYDRVDYGFSSGGDNHIVSVSDNERLGSEEQTRLNSWATFTRNDFDSFINNQISSGASLSTEHRENLTSSYQANYDRFTSGDFTSDGIFGQAQLEHRLYDSLTSTLTALGADNESSDRFSTGYNRYYGGGLGFDYAKRLSSTSRLQVNNAFLLQHVDQKSIGIAENERHSFTGGGVPNTFFLNLPFVDQSTIMVWNVARTRLFMNGIDYVVIRNGSLTGIQRVITSTIDNVVVVDYRAAPTPAGSYESFSDTFGVRLGFFDDLWGVYGRAQWFLNNAPSDLRIQEITSYTVGSDVNWRWLRAGAEMEYYDATYSQYWVARLYQGASFALDDESSLSIEFSQSWTDYISSDSSQQNYRFIARYHRNLSSRLWLNVDGGIDVQRGDFTSDRTLAVFRPSIRYVVGRTTINAEYDFEYTGYMDAETQQRHLFLLSLKRYF